MRRAPAALLALAVAGCTTTLESGERRYREGDRIGALEIWRAASEDDPAYPIIAERINDPFLPFLAISLSASIGFVRVINQAGYKPAS